ncbi:helix-turn-helix domain-containing protein [Cytophaga hutchinsonii]|uniref:Transcriptional regulator, AraC family n=1 Tax=Cytophaga hutchinsonii (strain ATCC 33406 / DSM 1761 / CIP 103989 / NBRC 15051 / NCIMB 9469 / D465) TaxID=269798 RepID=A0A6N4SQ16_CYTH3|nr:AraC family transcriptional regulator [Cytophaga hutchinsonii]ABG58374.1 transcriptional regulator, AraC family [Cytophaga hutchinsonii ATCC 33406]SFX51464.1 transcriptional regulator, AraC family [Cytophaga hutchinsonii ATCC 33406]
MGDIQYTVRDDLKLFVNSIMVQQSADGNARFRLPLYADGYPGIMFQQSESGFFRFPESKQLSEFFLYGQTLEPISLEVQGTYRFVVFQLYPFASKYLLGIDPKELNDACYDLMQFQYIDMEVYSKQLTAAPDPESLIACMSDGVAALIGLNKPPHNDRIQQAIKQIIETEGRMRISDLSEAVCLSERTLERNFLGEVGLSPKQFAKIIQFQSSLTKLTDANAETLTAIGLDSGFTDQSHFIRVFKQYTGQTPSQYIKNQTR